jgi:N utilization substance protein B
MTRRSRAREVALQLLFWRDLNPTAPRPAVEKFVRERLRDPGLEPFCLGLFDGVVARHTEIDALLTTAAENWRLTRMAAVDRNVLRLAAAELLATAADAPAAVVMNEAIELARRYGSKDSPAFVNGVLDKVNQLRIADCGLRIEGPAESAAIDHNPQSEIQNPQSVDQLRIADCGLRIEEPAESATIDHNPQSEKRITDCGLRIEETAESAAIDHNPQSEIHNPQS